MRSIYKYLVIIFCLAGITSPALSQALTGGSITVTIQNITAGGQPRQIFCSAATGGGCTASTYRYQWQQTLDYVTYTDIPGATGLNYTPPPLYVTTHFVRVVYCGTQRANSNAATVNVFNPFSGGTISADATTIPYNTSANFSNVASASGGICTGSIIYIWWGSTDGVNYTQLIPFDGASGASPPLTSSMHIYRQARCTNNFEQANSNIITITIAPPLQSGITPSSLNIVSGADGGTIQTTPSGGACNGTYSYQWESSTDNINFGTAPGNSTAQLYHPGTIYTTTYFRCHVYCGTEQIYTPVTTVMVTQQPNYIRTRVIKKPGITDRAGSQSLADPNDVQQTTTYFDGLGRSIQSVSKQASPLGKDLVLPQVYDSFGRTAMHYLPYTGPSSDGIFRINALNEQAAFNASQFPNEQYYYGKTDFEPSPLNRPVATYAAGNSWIGSGRGIATNYLFNDGADSVRVWDIAMTSGSMPASTRTYSARLLYKNFTADEQGHQAVEYKDVEGHIVLQKVQSWDNPAAGHSGWLCTYYVYDDLGNLRFVLPPKAVDLISGSGWALSQAIADELCFRYEYDARERNIIKKIPGTGEVRMVYDMRDRLVMTQDSNARHDGYWITTKYDDLNRPDSIGKLIDGNSRDYHQNLANSTPGYPLITGTGYTSYTRTFYDDYSWLPAATPLLNSNFATKYVNAPNYFITNLNTSPQYAQAMTASQGTRGMVTGTAADVIGSVINLFRVNFYDDRGRLLQTISTNFQSGRDTTTFQYDFEGKVLRKLLTQNNAFAQQKLYTVSTKFGYDAMGRPAGTWMRLDNAASDQPVDSLIYDELGQLKAKYLGGALDSLVYDYNIRGWIDGINRSFIQGSAQHYFGMELGYDKTVTVANGTTFGGLQYNGNIAGIVWKSAGDGVSRKYDLTYDNVNRLTGAGFSQSAAGGGWGNTAMDYSVHNLTYDAGGNIMSMSQHGWKLGAPTAAIDSLTYGYLTNTNRLNTVADVVNDPNSVLGDFHYNSARSGQDYQYDANGNLVVDKNKGITGISHNFLNLPEYFSIPGKGSIQITYDAAGNKLRKIVWDSISRRINTTTYTEGLVYYRTDSFVTSGNAQDTLQFVIHPEGRARWALHYYTNGSSAYGWEYDFFEKDHLGNTRIVLTQQKDTAQYMATMEAAYRAKEMALFYNIDSTSYPASSVPGGYPTDGTTSPNDSVARVNGSGHKMGPALLLKVMSGDSIAVGVKSFYRPNSSPGPNNSSISDVLNSLAQGLISLSGPGHGTITDLNNTSGSPVYTALNSFLPANETSTTGKPKAYLNWMLLDNQFNYVGTGGQSGALPVGNADVLNTLAQGVGIHHSGYLYIWVSNETQNWDVFFDNLSVTHFSGPMLEESHYYPFGLTMAGISDKAIKTKYAQNKYRYNGKELQDQEFSGGAGIEEYDYGARFYDYQIGRFTATDPHSDKYYSTSPYSYVLNDPIRGSDPTGMDTYLSGDAAQEAWREIQSMPAQSIDVYDRMAQRKVKEHGGESNANGTIKAVLPVFESITPETFAHIRDAVELEGKPLLLTRGFVGIDDLNRPIALRGHKNLNPDINWLDEYPFASTVEGGFGASVREVAIWEQRLQGGQLSALYTFVNVNQQFLVMLVPESDYKYQIAPRYYKLPGWEPSKGWMERNHIEQINIPHGIDVIPLLEKILERGIKLPPLFTPPTMFPPSSPVPVV